jgi:hypothetical protein
MKPCSCAIFHGILWEGLRQTMKNLRIVYVPGNIRNMLLLCAGQEGYNISQHAQNIYFKLSQFYNISGLGI